MPKWNRANVLLALFFLVRFQIQAASWKHLSSSTGDLPIPGRSTQQTGAVVADFNKDGTNDFVLSFRQVAPALVLYQKTGIGWDRLIIETNYLTIEAGGAVYDIDGDGDLDLVFGGDWQSNEVWWWENPFPSFKPDQPWKRHNIKKSGAKQHHDQVFADFLGEGKAQLAFWNQGANKIYLARIPDSLPDPWELLEVFSGNAGVSGKGEFKYPEGLAAFDIDGDGKLDLLAGNLWLRNRGNHVFTPVPFASIGGRIAAAKLKRGKYPQVVIAPGDGIGPLRWYECNGDPEKPTDWLSHDLLSRDMIHGHTLQIADIDGDGNLDIFAAEMAKWTESKQESDNPNATAWIFYGDGKGNFHTTVFSTGIDFHEGRLADLNGDGIIDILDKPYNWEAPRVDVWLQSRD